MAAFRASLNEGLDPFTCEQLAREGYDVRDARMLGQALEVCDGNADLDARLRDEMLRLRESGRELACRGCFAEAEELYVKCLALLESMHRPDRAEHNWTLALQAALLSVESYTNLDNAELLEQLYAEAKRIGSMYLPAFSELVFAVRLQGDDLDGACLAMAEAHGHARALVKLGLPACAEEVWSKADQDFMWRLYQTRLPRPV